MVDLQHLSEKVVGLQHLSEKVVDLQNLSERVVDLQKLPDKWIEMVLAFPHEDAVYDAPFSFCELLFLP